MEEESTQEDTKKLLIGIGIAALLVVVAILIINYKQKREVAHICPNVVYGEFINPDTKEVKSFKGCEIPPDGWKMYVREDQK